PVHPRPSQMALDHASEVQVVPVQASPVHVVPVHVVPSQGSQRTSISPEMVVATSLQTGSTWRPPRDASIEPSPVAVDCCTGALLGVVAKALSIRTRPAP